MTRTITSFKPILTLGYTSQVTIDADGSECEVLTPGVQNASIKMGLTSAEDDKVFADGIASFAKDHLGMLLINRGDLRSQALASTFAPIRENDIIQWDQPLFDSDGYPHTLVALSSFDVVTRCSIAYIVWDRKTGDCKMPDCEDYRLSNTPMSAETRAQREAEALQALRSSPAMSEHDKDEMEQRLTSIPRQR